MFSVDVIFSRSPNMDQALCWEQHWSLEEGKGGIKWEKWNNLLLSSFAFKEHFLRQIKTANEKNSDWKASTAAVWVVQLRANVRSTIWSLCFWVRPGSDAWSLHWTLSEWVVQCLIQWISLDPGPTPRWMVHFC